MQESGSSLTNLKKIAILSDQIQFVGNKFGVLEDNLSDNFDEGWFIIDEYGKIVFSSQAEDCDDMSADKVI